MTTIRDLLRLPIESRRRVVAALSARQRELLYFEWSLWARPEQALPDGDWIYWIVLAGRGAGKTRTGAEAVRAWVRDFSIVNIVGPTRDDVRDVMVLGESGILARCPREERPTYLRASGRLAWPNGATTLLFSAEEPDRLRGRQHMKLWCDELAAWRKNETFDNALLGLRLGSRPQAVITTTPRPLKLIKQLLNDQNAVVTRGTTYDNSEFLADGFVRRITARYAGRPIGRQELFAEIVEETPGALWTFGLLERQRIEVHEAPTEFCEIVVGVDPPAKSGPNADECGIIVAARTDAGKVYVLGDHTSRGETPGRWAARVASVYRRHKADRVVAECNNGGEMVSEVLRHGETHLPVRLVSASRGKYVRAEPVAAAYERGLVFHVGAFDELERQLCALTPDFDRKVGESPDRADALVWAVSDLLRLHRPDGSAILDYYAAQAASLSDQ